MTTTTAAAATASTTGEDPKTKGKQRESNDDDEVFIVGYTDKLSGRVDGDKIRFHVSSHSSYPYTATLTRSVSADPNPEGPGIVEEDASEWFQRKEYPSRRQSWSIGSYATSSEPIPIPTTDANNRGPKTEISFWFYPTMVPCRRRKRQYLVSWGNLHIAVGADGRIEVIVCYDNNDQDEDIIAPTDNPAIKQFRWYNCSLALEQLNRESSSSRVSVMLAVAKKRSGEGSSSISRNNTTTTTTTQSVRASWDGGSLQNMILGKKSKSSSSSSTGAFFSLATNGTYNGKIEHPMILVGDNNEVLACWDFGREGNMSSFTVPPSPQSPGAGCNLVLHNHPTRAVKGRFWDGSEFHYLHKPQHYAAIYFHDDDVYDFKWDVDFEWRIPAGTPSGIYVMRLQTQEGYYDAIPIFVCPPLPLQQEQKKKDLVVLVSTFTYVIYGNHARPDFEPSWLENADGNKDAYPYNPAMYPNYGLSTYNYHSDNNRMSGICYASHKRPLFNLRPGYRTFGNTSCSGLRHFQADSHLISWLHNKGIEYDIITDHELDRDGVAAISNYRALLTGTHPEYHTKQSLDALQNYRDVVGGNIAYLGGNGFYWKIVRHPTETSLLEIRRAEGGLRAWACESGEYYHAFGDSTQYGGLWRNNNRPPQQLVGVGFTAQGNFVAMPYKRTCYDPKFDWIFGGIDDNNEGDGVLGDFGFSAGGAAGFELDRVDPNLDHNSDYEITILAQSFDKDNKFILVPEEMLTHLSNLSGKHEDEVRRADMVYFESTEEGMGKVFSVGSICFCGSLPWNDYENNISSLLMNVIRKFTATTTTTTTHNASS